MARTPLAHRPVSGASFGKRQRFWIFADLGMLFFVAAALIVGWTLGLLPADVTHSEPYKIAAQLKPDQAQLIARWPRAAIVVLVLANAPIAPLVNGVFTFGEEWGWRGWLLPKLLPLGQWRALVLSGAIWGAWHAPVVALGYNYPQHPALGPLLMIVFCVIIGILLGWTRLATGSVWPAVIGHAVINATSAAHALLGPEGSFDTAQATILGWSGWLLPLAFIAWLAATRRLPVATARTPVLLGESIG
jgi:membrane protease YdiL (CAAX protease family)